MREIKFRVWVSEIGALIYNININSDGYYFYLNNGIENVQPGIPIMQFTGLYDCNGVEIFEGDIVKLWIGKNKKSILRVVEYLGSCFQVWDEFGVGVNLDEWAANAIEVVGNVCQNPGLVKE